MNSSLQQSDIWKSFQRSIGREVFEIEDNNEKFFITKIPLKKGFCWFLMQKAYFNDVETHCNVSLPSLWEKIENLAKKENAIFIRFENCNLDIKQIVEPRHAWALRKAHQSYLPETSLIIDLKMNENDILNQMKQKGRYNIRLAEKKGVKIEKYDFKSDLNILKNKIKIFHDILKETTSRDGFSSNSEEFYSKMLVELKEHAKLYMAEYDGKYLAGIIVTSYGDTATYYYGASSNTSRELMAPYLLQWHAIKDAKEDGYEIYDFLGIAPQNTNGTDVETKNFLSLPVPFKPKKHPLSTVTDFKLKFGGQVINHQPSQEYIFKPIFYIFLVAVKFLLRKLWNRNN